MTTTLRSEYNFAPSSGAVVLSVVANSPAANAGLVQGDVITSFNSIPVNSSQALQSAAESTPSFTSVQVGYTDTSGAPQTANITLGSFPQDSPGPPVSSI